MMSSVEKDCPVFEHRDFYALYKPTARSFHCEEATCGFFDSAQKQLNEPLWPVHRLDKLTSGLVLAARSPEAAEHFRRLFSHKQIKKCYLALSDRKPRKKQGWIKGDLRKARGGNYKLLRTVDNPAITQFYSYSLAPGLRLFNLIPHTGKTHQLRVTLKSIGSPIIGDQRYGGSESDRGYLHAFRLAFSWLGERIDLQIAPQSGKLFAEHWAKIESLMTDTDPFGQ